jgi:hypothetical protein
MLPEQQSTLWSWVRYRSERTSPDFKHAPYVGLEIYFAMLHEHAAMLIDGSILESCAACSVDTCGTGKGVKDVKSMHRPESYTGFAVTYLGRDFDRALMVLLGYLPRTRTPLPSSELRPTHPGRVLCSSLPARKLR